MKSGWIKKVLGKKEIVPELKAIGYCITTIRPGTDYSVESIIQKTPGHYRCLQPNLYLKDDEYKLFDSFESALQEAEELCYSKYFLNNYVVANLYFDGKKIEVTQKYKTIVADSMSVDAPVQSGGSGWGGLIMTKAWAEVIEKARRDIVFLRKTMLKNTEIGNNNFKVAFEEIREEVEARELQIESIDFEYPKSVQLEQKNLDMSGFWNRLNEIEQLQYKHFFITRFVAEVDSASVEDNYILAKEVYEMAVEDNFNNINSSNKKNIKNVSRMKTQAAQKTCKDISKIIRDLTAPEKKDTGVIGISKDGKSEVVLT